jgi:CRP-like cAMP-binding protein
VQNQGFASDPKARALGQVPLFARCTGKELEFIASRTDEVNAPVGTRLTCQGRRGDAFYVLLEGQVDVVVDGERRRTLGTGEFFGEISMLDRGLATATIYTRSVARLMVMSHAQFRDAIEASDSLLVKVKAAMGERLRADNVSRG